MDRARLGVIEHRKAQCKRERGCIPELENHPREAYAQHHLAVKPDGRAPSKVGIDNELFDLVQLAQLHLCSRRDVVFQLIVFHRSPKSKNGRQAARHLRRVDRRQCHPFERGDANAAG
jgi:hypothetical protein